MKKQKTGIPQAEVTAEDAAQLVAAYGKTPDPERKAALLARLEKERAVLSGTEAKPATRSPSQKTELGRE